MTRVGQCSRRTVGNANVVICGESYRLLGKGATAAMKKRTLLLVGLACAVAAVFAVGARGDAAAEIGRLAELMGWKAGTVVADIGAGGGKYAVAAGGRGGAAGGRVGAGGYGSKIGGVAGED